MSGAMLALFGVVLAAAIGDLMIPGEEKGGTRQFLHFMTALCVLLLLLSPFRSLVQSTDDLLRGEIEWGDSEVKKSDFEKKLSDAVASRSASELREGLTALLQEKYGIAPEDAEIAVVLNERGELCRLSVLLKGAALLTDPEEIRGDLLELFSCEVEVR